MNGYLVGGKQVALSGSTGLKVTNPFQYVGGMWVLAGQPVNGTAWYYTKYPIGLPLLNAIPLWINWEHGKAWAMYISPACTSLALLAMFLMARRRRGFVHGHPGDAPAGDELHDAGPRRHAWSHGPALFFVTWGMYLLVRWWQTGSVWRGILAGFLLGYAVTIRYTEGLLALAAGRDRSALHPLARVADVQSGRRFR